MSRLKSLLRFYQHKHEIARTLRAKGVDTEEANRQAEKQAVKDVQRLALS